MLHNKHKDAISGCRNVKIVESTNLTLLSSVKPKELNPDPLESHLPIHLMRTKPGRGWQKTPDLQINRLQMNDLKMNEPKMNDPKMNDLQMKLFRDRLLPSVPRTRWILRRSSLS